MSAFIIKRLLWGIPTLLVIFLLCFAMLNRAPEEAVNTYMSNNLEGVKALENVTEYEYYYIQSVRKLELDKPAFYFTLTNKARPEFIDTIDYLPQKKLAENLCLHVARKQRVGQYFSTIDQLSKKLSNQEISQKAELLRALFLAKSDAAHSPQLDSLALKMESPALQAEINTITSLQKEFAAAKPNADMLIPVIRWNGTDNRFHRMITRIFSNEKNISLIDSRPVWKKIREALGYTLSVNLLAFVLSVLVSYRLAIWLNLNAGRTRARITGGLLFVMYTMPAFWVGSMLLMFFSSSTYSSLLNWFPPGGVGDPGPTDGFLDVLGVRLYHYILPVFCISYPVIVFLTTHLRDGIAETSGEQWAVTARAKGLDEGTTLKKHVLVNAVFPYITLLGNMIPSIFAGSVIIEVLFNIPGAGRLAYQSIISRDWPVLFNIILISGIVTVLAQILTDVVYASLDPRIKHNR